MKSVYLYCLLLFLGSLLQAQDSPFSQGLEMEDEAYDQLLRLPEVEGIKNTALPAKVDLSKYCPEVRHQGKIFSCVGWAVGYGALTIEKAIRNGWTNKKQITEQAYSALYIYNQIKKGDCSKGSRLSEAMEFLRKEGDCLAREFDYEIENCKKLPDPALIQRARRDTITEYMTLFASKANSSKKVDRVRHALAAQHPVVVGMAVRMNFYQLRDARYWWPDLGRTAPAGGHALVVVGYDDASRSFLLFNSWGKEWGDNGYIRIKYEHFGAHCKYAFILHKIANQEQVPGNNPMRPGRDLRQFSGQFTMKYLEDYSEHSQEPLFVPAAVKGENGRYQLSDKSWKISQLFQLEAANPGKEIYLYVFSIDPLDNIHIHWPRQAGLSKKYRALNESAFIPYSGSRIMVPGKDKALRLTHRGTDRLYVFFSTKKIRHLRFICEKMRYVEKDHLLHLQKIMGRHLVPAADIQYDSDRISFTAHTRSKGYLVPVLLEVNAK